MKQHEARQKSDSDMRQFRSEEGPWGQRVGIIQACGRSARKTESVV